ncbi:MAG TPA: hypothetical protein VFB21_25730, partial [Chthonomonadaceae bacterium]|nr:hypothetical protein [Chthonomonadaceae bacterium]
PPYEGESQQLAPPPYEGESQQLAPPPYEGESQQLAPPPYEGGGRGEVPNAQRLTEGVPFSFMFVGDAHQWRDEISITTEGADFLLRDTHLYWSDGKGPVAPFPESEMHPDDLARADTPDGAFIATLRGEPQVVSAPETVWPVLRFTLTALASAANGSVPQQTAEAR